MLDILWWAQEAVECYKAMPSKMRNITNKKD